MDGYDHVIFKARDSSSNLRTEDRGELNRNYYLSLFKNMAVLLVKFAEDLNLPDYTIYHVEESDARVAQDVELIIQNATPIHYGDARIVYKGELSRGNLAQTEEIVLKLVVARHEDARPALENEYSFYCNQLKDLQGTAVPKCYGMFKDPNESHFALVLQYCGEPACSEDFKSPFQQINTRYATTGTSHARQAT